MAGSMGSPDEIVNRSEGGGSGNGSGKSSLYRDGGWRFARHCLRFANGSDRSLLPVTSESVISMREFWITGCQLIELLYVNRSLLTWTGLNTSGKESTLFPSSESRLDDWCIGWNQQQMQRLHGLHTSVVASRSSTSELALVVWTTSPVVSE